ncbi:hypothetical protein [Streptomyces rhizosphaerihabitans]|uniref:hypothetical protein n=1 Tax=Streptomyces rhizosphaerihabitans TaxID=1266770 RepID=UPI0021BDF6B6|nr:hypothetical protein [Streptomyces rhizosphaerihabitans]MCT9008805.1 hypothetical protein [Streptomyces rhizosphaerihabitans]
MIDNLIAPLVVAALIGLVVGVRRWLKRGDPLAVTGEIIVPKAWELALPTADALPSHVPEDKRSYWPMYWLLHHRGAADFKVTNAKVLIENRSEQPLTITNITVHKEQEGAPLSAAWVRYPPAGAAEALVLDFLLDEEQPSAWSATYESLAERPVRTGSRPYFDDHVINLSPGETQSLLVTGRADTVRCSWWLNIETSQAGKRRVIPVVPEGGSFATSGTPVNGFDHRWEWSWYDGAAASFITPPEFD